MNVPLGRTLALGAFGVVLALHAFHYKELQDFAVYATAASRFASAEPLYRLSDGTQCFKYAPIVAAAFIPFEALGRAGTLGWLLLCAAALTLFGRASATGDERGSWIVVELCVLAWLLPYARSLFALGQCDVVVLALIVLSERLRHRPALSGLLLAPAILFKLPFLLLLPWLALLGERRRAAFAIGGIVAGLLLPALRYGLGGNFEQLSQWRALLAETTPSMICHGENQSLYGLACRYGTTPSSGAAFYLPVWLCAGALLAIAAWVVLGQRRFNVQASRALGLSLTLYLAAFLSPLGWRSNLLVLAPFFYRLWTLWPRASRPLRALLFALPTVSFVAGVLAFDLFGRDVFARLMELRVLSLCAFAFVAGMVELERRSVRVLG